MFGRSKKARRDREAAEQVEQVVEDVVGPFDVSEAPDDGVARLDFGSLRIPNPADVKVQVEFVEKTHVVRQVQIVQDDSEVHVGVFAAPRNEDVWEEAREEIVKSVERKGGQVEEVDGPYGVELLARGKGHGATVRYAGVSGPRWLLRAVFRGPRAEDVDAAPALDEALRGMVVDRGEAAMPILEALPLKMPPQAVELHKKRAELAAARKAGATPGRVNGAGSRRPSPKPKR
ncbi:MAG: DUF3710 domain-containing protein [Stackebrandtia sp.]